MMLFFQRSLIALVVLLASSGVSSAATTIGQQTELLARLQGTAKSVLPVIIRFDEMVSGLYETGKSAAIGYGSQIKQAQQLLINRLAVDKAQYLSIKQFTYVPLLSVHVNERMLLELLKDPRISVFADELYRPALAQSVPLVYSNRNDSPFHGDNDWAVAIIDSGVDVSHPMLAGKLVAEACFSTTNPSDFSVSLCPNGDASSTAVTSGSNCDLALTGCDHGTQVAGIAVGNDGSNEGVARDGKLISVQVNSRIDSVDFCVVSTSCIVPYASDVILGLEHIYSLRNTHKIAAVNLSSVRPNELVNGTCDNEPEKLIIDMLRQSNIPVVISAGNDLSNQSSSEMPVPACISSAVTVAATLDTSDNFWSSNFISDPLDIFAPGVDITTADAGGGLDTVTGTSFAAAHVSGAWAVFRHSAPDLSVDQIEDVLRTVGPEVTQNSITRRRLDISLALPELVSLQAIASDFCFPLLPSNGKAAIICL